MNYINNDNELIYMINEDKDLYEAELFAKYKPIINKIASDYYYSSKYCGIDLDDIVQEAYIGFYNALRNYDNKTSLFYTYSIICINRSIITFLRKCNNYNNTLLNDSLPDDMFSFSKLFDEDIFDNITYESTYLDKKNQLNLKETLVFELKSNGFNTKEISKLLDCSLSEVYRFTHKYKKILKTQINN